MKDNYLKVPAIIVGILMLTVVFSGCEDDDDDDNSPPEPIIEISRVEWKPYQKGERLEKGSSIEFDGSKTTDPDGDPLLSSLFKWDFDDSNGVTTERTGKTATHRYYETGDYTVTLRVSDGEVEASTTLSISLYEKGGSLRAVIELQEDGEEFVVHENDDDPGTVEEEEVTLHFDGGNSVSEEGSITEYRWDFSHDDEDGFQTEATGSAATQEFRSGYHIVVLNVTNESGGNAADFYQLFIDYNETYENQTLPGQYSSDDNFTDYSVPMNTLGCQKISFRLSYNVSTTGGQNEDDLDIYLYNATGDEVANTQAQPNGTETLELRWFDGNYFVYREQLGDWTVRVTNDNYYNDIDYELYLDIYYDPTFY